MADPEQALIDGVRDRLAELADPAKAGPMQAYMKSAMPFRGVQSPGVKQICKELFTAYPIRDRGTWEVTVRELFDQAAYREERYAAVALAGHRAYDPWQDPDMLELYDHLVVTGAWWDFVDEIASRRVGPILLAYPDRVPPVLLVWARDQDPWRRRTAILAQLKAKERTDAELLASCIRPSLDDRDFFLRKGIGWALREYAKTDPAWVRRYVDDHRDRLSPLSIREAEKQL